VSDLAGYFLITGRNIASDHARRSRLAPVIADISQLEHIADPYPSAEQFAVGQQELARLQRVIDAMPPRARQVFVLSRIEGLTYVEIGNQLGISPKTVFSHMVVALERLQAGMQTS
jgi:RNA polymerase sigma-70 factor (ECF subfamily)